MKKEKSPPATGPEAAKRFESLTRRVIAVPKSKIEAAEQREGLRTHSKIRHHN